MDFDEPISTGVTIAEVLARRAGRFRAELDKEMMRDPEKRGILITQHFYESGTPEFKTGIYETLELSATVPHMEVVVIRP